MGRSTWEEQPSHAPTPAADREGSAGPAGEQHRLDGLAAGLANREFSAFSQLYSLVADRLLRVAVRLVPDRGLAEDAVGETFTELTRLERLPPDGRGVETWLFRSVIAQADARIGDLPDSNREREWLQLDEDLEAALATLTVRQRLAVHLAHVEQLDDAQIAEILDVGRLSARRSRATGERRLAKLLGVDASTLGRG